MNTNSVSMTSMPMKKIDPSMHTQGAVSGEFVEHEGERFYVVRNVDGLPPFFTSMVSDSDHWLFASSTGGLTAGRVSPETAFFPYITVDKIHESVSHTGPKTIIRVEHDGEIHNWEPFNHEHDGRFCVSRNLYKNALGNKLCFEEINHSLMLRFSYSWMSSERFGFIRQCSIKNLSDVGQSINVLDGLQNILPAGTPRHTQTNSSNLVDAYKWNELEQQTGLGLFTLFSAITDRAEPCESLRANTAFCVGLNDGKKLLSSDQLAHFRVYGEVDSELHKRGIRGAYFVQKEIKLGPQVKESWLFACNVEQNQTDIVALEKQLQNTDTLLADIHDDIESGSDALGRIMAGSDGFQFTNEVSVAEHHYANVLFNNLRGGVFDNQYSISLSDFTGTLRLFNQPVFEKHKTFLDALPAEMDSTLLGVEVEKQNDAQLSRLFLEYLPITFGRRHGDPSRPWNQFLIKLKDDRGQRLLSYQGNWRDIFQNWEALALSYPEFIESVVAKFVNASTIDGFNPYRITKEGVDWEVEDPDDPWSYIGYWGDHQIIYLLKLLEWSKKFHPEKLGTLLQKPVFSFANVPYRIKGFEDLVRDAKNTVEFDSELASIIEKRVETMGADGKLVLDSQGEVYQVNLLEKLLIPLLSKLGNLVVGGGIWLNTQRPEWNDANNALVGQGLSMVTLYYMRRYIRFMQDLLDTEQGEFSLSTEVSNWLSDTKHVLADLADEVGSGPLNNTERMQTLSRLGEAFAQYRDTLYDKGCFSGSVQQSYGDVRELLAAALVVIDDSISQNRRADGLYHAYNLISFRGGQAEVNNLYAMLEGQVAVLSSGSLPPKEAVGILDALFASDIFREDQHTFMLYPDRKLPSFLEKNCVPAEKVSSISLLNLMMENNDTRLMSKDANGEYRFHASLNNHGALNTRLASLVEDYGDLVQESSEQLNELYEEVFNHQAFTGRSGGMFGFEGLGCIYWHMVSKLLLAVQENFFEARNQSANEQICKRLGELYYEVRKGIGFNKTPAEYGAFPCDPYSHTPKHAGAQQPGMTGQVKEEIITRFGELGVRVEGGKAEFKPTLLRACEFRQEPGQFRYLDVHNLWHYTSVPAQALAFTWCQVPIIYVLCDDGEGEITVHHGDECEFVKGLALSDQDCENLFKRTGEISKLTVQIPKQILFS